MTNEEIFNKVKEILVDHTQFDKPDSLTMNSKLKEDINIDSLDTFEIIYDIENEFDIKVADQDASEFSTLGDIVEYIAKNQAK